MIVFTRSGGTCRFLLLLSKLTKRPLWEFPKGGVDEGETPLIAAMRELEEETGLRSEDVRLVDGFERREEYRFTSGKGEGRSLIRKQVTYYLAEAMREDVRVSPSETSEHAWLELDAALKKIRYKERRAMLQDAARLAGCA